MIVVPEDFDRERIDWARTYILAITGELENRSAAKVTEKGEHLLRSTFGDARHVVVGLTCMAR